MTDSFKSSIASMRTAIPEGPLKPCASVPTQQIAPISPPASIKKAGSEASDELVSTKATAGPVVDWDGNYTFAPIKEHQVSRAMTKRYYEDLMKTAVSVHL